MRKTIALTIVFVTLLIMLVACSGFEISEEEQQFIGTWVSLPTEGTIMTVIFHDDKTAEIKINEYRSTTGVSDEIITATGYWNLYDGKLTVNYGENLTTYSIAFTIADDSLQCKWHGNFILFRDE